MNLRTFALATAAAGLVAMPALAQGVAGGSPPSSSMPPSSMPSSSMPSSEMPGTPGAMKDHAPTAETGTATNTAATAGDLKVGSSVNDSAGSSIGSISKISKGKDGETWVTLKADGKTKNVPASSLSLSGGALTSSQTKSEVWGPQ